MSNSPSTIVPTNFAFSVFDEETRKQMVMKELINHPNPIIKEKWIHSVSNKYGRLLKGVGKKCEGSLGGQKF